MDTLSAMARAMASQGREQRVFDWDRAAQLIRERKPTRASAGLSGDWEWTGGTIYINGDPVRDGDDAYTYLASTWATPELDLDGDRIDCWRLVSQTPGWDADTKWPESALKILRGEVSP